MEVWIIHGGDIESTGDLAFEVRRFQAEAAKMDIDLKIIKPVQFDLLVTQESRDSILVDGAPMAATRTRRRAGTYASNHSITRPLRPKQAAFNGPPKPHRSSTVTSRIRRRRRSCSAAMRSSWIH